MPLLIVVPGRASTSELSFSIEALNTKINIPPKNGKTKIIPLKNKAGFIRKRSEIAVLRYYLNYSNDEDLARGLLILFLPFRDEMVDIHTKDVKQLLFDSSKIVDSKRAIFKRYKLMTDLISSIQTEVDVSEDRNDVEEEDSNEIETTCVDDYRNS